MFGDQLPSPMQEIFDPLLKEKSVSLLIKRDDLLHPQVSGNKWRKLKYNLLTAKKAGHDTLLTFGGAYSNHIYATATAAAEMGFKSIGIIRGEENLPLNGTLQFAVNKGMRLIYMDREKYRLKHSQSIIKDLEKRLGRFYIIPEGGSNALAIQGCKEIVKEISVPYDYICCAAGTGGTVSGLIAGLQGKQQIIGFSALKGDFLEEEIKALLANAGEELYDNWQIFNQYHFGGYAKVQPSLMAFVDDFLAKHKVLWDPIYTGKMIYGLYDLIKNDYFPEGARIVAVHTGGIQGWGGIQERYGTKYNLDFLPIKKD